MNNIDFLKEWMNNPKNIRKIKRYKVKDVNSSYFRMLLTSLIIDNYSSEFELLEYLLKNIFEIKKDIKQFLIELGFSDDLCFDPLNNQKNKNIIYLKNNGYSSKEELLTILTKTQSCSIDTSNLNEVFLNDLFKYYELEANSWFIAAINNDYDEIDRLINNVDLKLSNNEYIESLIKTITKHINKYGLQKQVNFFQKPFAIKNNRIINFKESHYSMPDVLYFSPTTKKLYISNCFNSFVESNSIMPLIQIFRVEKLIIGLSNLELDLMNGFSLLKQKRIDISSLNQLTSNATYYQSIIQNYNFNNCYFDFLDINLVLPNKLIDVNSDISNFLLETEKKDLMKIEFLSKDDYIYLVQLYKIFFLKINIIKAN